MITFPFSLSCRLSLVLLVSVDQKHHFREILSILRSKILQTDSQTCLRKRSAMQVHGSSFIKFPNVHGNYKQLRRIDKTIIWIIYFGQKCSLTINQSWNHPKACTNCFHNYVIPICVQTPSWFCYSLQTAILSMEIHLRMLSLVQQNTSAEFFRACQ